MPTPPDSVVATDASGAPTQWMPDVGLDGRHELGGGCGLGTGRDSDEFKRPAAGGGLGWFGELLGLPQALVSQCTSARPVEAPASSPGLGGCGVGLLLEDCDTPSYNNYNVTVKRLSEGGPADLSKQIQKGDKILRIDGKDVVGMRTADLGPLLIGPVGSAVSLQMLRGPAWKNGGEGTPKKRNRPRALPRATLCAMCSGVCLTCCGWTCQANPTTWT